MVEVDPLLVESSGIAHRLDSVLTLVLTVCSPAVWPDGLRLAVVWSMVASVPLALKPLLCNTVLAVWLGDPSL